jgi:Zn-dependent protease with chaperone function
MMTLAPPLSTPSYPLHAVIRRVEGGAVQTPCAPNEILVWYDNISGDVQPDISQAKPNPTFDSYVVATGVTSDLEVMTYDVPNLSYKSAIQVLVAYRVSCLPGKETLLVKTLARGNNPTHTFENLLRTLINDFQYQNAIDPTSFIEQFDMQRERLVRYLVETAQRRLGVRLEVRLSFEQRKTSNRTSRSAARPVQGGMAGTAKPRNDHNKKSGYLSGLPDDLVIPPNLPVLKSEMGLNMKEIRDPLENFYLSFVIAANVMVFMALMVTFYYNFVVALSITGFGLFIGLFSWITWKLFYCMIFGNSVVVTPNQYPQIYTVVKAASEYLKVPMPQVLILQSHGLFELFIARRFTRRGLIIICSSMIDEFSQKPTSREFMMLVGRQLGHIKAGHFRYWFFKDVIGIIAFFFYFAWRRRCHFTADRVGLLVAGDLDAAKQGLYILMVGARIAPGTNYAEIVEQHTELFDSYWSWLQLSFSEYPYMIDRVVRLHDFAERVTMGQFSSEVGAIPIQHHGLKSIPILLIHGHDRLALLELKDFLHSEFPQVVPKVMVQSVTAALALPEKFEAVADEITGAIALLTPDDVGSLAARLEETKRVRARQNVVIEVGWVWGRLGRKRCLMLMRGDIEIPSDLSGIETFPFQQSPIECSEVVRSFIHQLGKNQSAD